MLAWAEPSQAATPVKTFAVLNSSHKTLHNGHYYELIRKKKKIREKSKPFESYHIFVKHVLYPQTAHM